MTQPNNLLSRVAIAALVTLTLLGTSSARQAHAQIQSPAEFLGYELGDRFTPHHRVVDYVSHVAQASPNVTIETYGQTYEHRPLTLLFVSTPDNLSRLDDIRAENIELTKGSATPTASPTAIVWLSYNVHGNESVGTEASLLTLFELADTGNARTQEWLENTLVIIDPCLNPDGRERYVQWYNRTAGAFVNPNSDDRTHNEPWPGGRSNHYYFDLNRDWAWASQKETRARLKRYNAWMPHVHVDFHEQGVNNPYYFAPAAEPYHASVTEWQRDFQTQIGRNHARYFDENGWLYFTRQSFDLLYPGYGDTWPTFNGSIGMTYEQAGSGRAGLAIKTAESDTLTLADRIAHHHTTGLSTIEVTAQNAGRVVAEFAAYFEPDSEPRTFVIKRDARGERAAALMHLLDIQGIEYQTVATSTTVSGRNYLDGRSGRHSVDPGDIVVSTSQPKGVLADVLLEPDPLLADSVTYDITTWSLPLLYGLDAVVASDARRLELTDVSTPTVPAVAAGIRPYAYLARFGSLEDHRFLAALHKAGILVRMAHEPISLAGQTFERGTLIITRTGNTRIGARFDEQVQSIAAKFGRELFPASTGFVDSGPDFGSGDVGYLKAPRVAVVGGSTVSSYSLGQIWHYFDERAAYPVTIVNGNRLGGTDLGQYDVLVMPSGSYGSVLDEDAMGDLRAWIRGGGKLIALDGAARFFAGKSGFALEMNRGAEPDSAAVGPVEQPYADRVRRRISDGIPGAIFLATADRTHPLAYGLGDRLPVLRRSSSTAKLLKQGWNVAVVEDGEPISGFAGHNTRKRIAGSLALGVQDVGRGTVVYAMDDLLFRGMWYTGEVLFGNAVFAVGTD